MKVRIERQAERDTLLFEGDNILEAGPSGTFFKVVESVEQEETKSGLITRVGGSKRHTWVPASTITKVEITE